MKFKLKCFRSKYMLDYWLIMITPVIERAFQVLCKQKKLI